ncbi:MAG: PEP/pyruvate-binding domain-containing protein [Deltaproteobacteria bacterium]|jgi:alpha-glucan,water dikinase
MMLEKIVTRSGVILHVEKRIKADGVELSLSMEKGEKCLLHWGLRQDLQAPWHMPPESIWPRGSQAFDQAAVQTPFLGKDGHSQIVIKLHGSMDYPLISFVLVFPDKDRWDNNNGRNYQINIPTPEDPRAWLTAELKKEKETETIFHERVYRLDKDGELAVAVSQAEDRYHVRLITNVPGPLILHWGIAKQARHEWALPPTPIRPAGTTVFQNKAAQTPFVDKGTYKKVHLVMGEQEAPMGISFILKEPQTGRWLKDHGRDFFIPIIIRQEHVASLGNPRLAPIAEEIIEKEMGRHSWTLMHRFNLCYDLLDRVGNDRDGLALIFIWLRFSAIRQLDWQRDYNTKPRELSHAQDRLTLKLADLYASDPRGGEFIRLTLTTMGRGGEGQRVRDEVLNIMHRHHIKEVSGHFMEEWHQKLHNNTTPDDVVICKAYLTFLRSNGDLRLFYETLEKAGVTKERLEGYERPILSQPDFIPHLKEALIGEFEHFLKILKDVHAGTDLETAIEAARHLFDPELASLVDFLWAHRDDGAALLTTLVQKITKARHLLAKHMNKGQKGLRERLFLDLALEDFLRIAVERNLHRKLTADDLAVLITMVLENLLITKEDEELSLCFRQWDGLRRIPGFGKEWSLEAKAVLERLGRALGAMIDDYDRVLQPKAELLGQAIQADTWTVTLFSEEVVRGRPVFVLSALLRHMDPILRKSAHLGDWQVASPGRGAGRIHVVAALRSIQGKRFSHPAVVVTDEIGGEEEIPEGVTAIITPDTTDIVSHVAIRARNARVLLATCYDSGIIERLQSLNGRWLRVTTSAAGDVVFEEIPGETEKGLVPMARVAANLSRPEFTAYAISPDRFTRENVGGKSNNLKHLKGRLPPWIYLPSSVALPFGVFEKVLSQELNRGHAKRYDALTREMDEAEEEWRPEVLGKLRETVLALQAPDDLVSSLRQVMEGVGLLWPGDWKGAWSCIKGVWGSKWNERAFLSRKTRGISHEDLFMAVLIQAVVKAEYSFVIHTVNPFTGNSDEIYAEIVPGLGETLVGNYPGKALSFSCKKGKDAPQVLAFPSKSIALFGGGLIFRSDSNGEDLAGYAGAGLYDSVMLEPPEKIRLDYSRQVLLQDKDFRKTFLTTVAKIGTIVEEVFQSPQDIEGAYAGGQYWVVQTRPQVGIEGE